MNKQHQPSVKRNYVYSVLYQILTIIIPLITAPYVSRILDADGIGIVSYSKSISQYFCLFALLGISNYGNRTIATVRNDKSQLSRTFWEIYSIQFCTSCTVLIAYFVYWQFFSVTDRTIALIQSLYIFGSLLDVSWLFFGLENFKITVSRNIVVKVLTLVFTFAFVHSKEDIWVYALLSAGGNALAQVLLWKDVRKYVHFRRPSFQAAISHIRPILVLFIPVITISIYKVMDKIMIGAISSMTQSGLYENAEKIINLPMSLVTALGSVMLPRMSMLFSQQKGDLAVKYIRQSMQFSMVLAVAMAFGFCAISSNFVPIYFGDGFSGCETVIKILSFTIVLISWANVVRTQYLIPNNRDREYIISVVAGAVVNLIANAILIPSYGAAGAALGTLLAEAFVTLTQSLLMRRELEYWQYLADMLPFLGAGILMCILVSFVGKLFPNNILLLIVQIAVGIVSYFIFACTFMLIFQRAQFKSLLTSLLRRSKPPEA